MKRKCLRIETHYQYASIQEERKTIQLDYNRVICMALSLKTYTNFVETREERNRR